jgi:hypothetical protein
MKIIPGLPRLPRGQWWEVMPSSSGMYYTVRHMSHESTPSPSPIPVVLGQEITRSWPPPTIRTIVRTAKVVHRRWLRAEARRAAPFVGKITGTPS